MIKLNTLVSDVTPQTWSELLWQHAQQLGLMHIDIVVDQASNRRRGLHHLKTLYPPQALLQDTPHEDAAETGPLLLRLAMSPDGPNPHLLKLLGHFDGQHQLLVLLSPLNALSLIQHLRHYLLAQWDHGLKKGVLRYYDPRVFRPVLEQLATPDQQHLLSAAYEWHWIDRDGLAAMIQPHQPPPAEPLPPPHDALNLQQTAIDVLSSWHQAELWRQEQLLTPDECGQPSREAMMDTLAQLQMAADRQQLLSQPARDAFIQQQLGATPG